MGVLEVLHGKDNGALCTISVHGEGARDPGHKTDRSIEEFNVQDAREAMGIDWMTMKGLSQAIPPAYAQFIGEQALEYINAGVRNPASSNHSGIA